MNEPATETMAGAGLQPLFRGGSPDRYGQASFRATTAVVQSAAELASSLNVKLICGYVDITRYLTEEPDDGVR